MDEAKAQICSPAGHFYDLSMDAYKDHWYSGSELICAERREEKKRGVKGRKVTVVSEKMLDGKKW